MQEVETVDEHCKHKDCVYRMYLCGGCGTEFCNYSVMEYQPRGCKISECTKYRKGDRKQKMTEIGLWWEIDDATVY